MSAIAFTRSHPQLPASQAAESNSPIPAPTPAPINTPFRLQQLRGRPVAGLVCRIWRDNGTSAHNRLSRIESVLTGLGESAAWP
jgi:hypothetical protein